MSFDTRTSEYPKAPQAEALVRRILSVADILTRVQHEQEDENDLEKSSDSEVRYRDRENRTSER